MQTKRSSNRPNPYLFALLLGVLSGCSASASISAGSSSDFERNDQDRAQTSGSEQRESNPHASGAALSRDEASASNAGEPEQPKEHGKAHADETTVATAKPVVATPAPHAANPASAGGGDHDRGHGNDQDGVDEDNPGKSKQATKKKAAKKAEVTAPPSDGDHDRGHGNDQDGVDEDNPGKSKKSK